LVVAALQDFSAFGLEMTWGLRSHKEGTIMLSLLGLGFVIGILAVIGLLRLTMREEPTGCFLVFGALFFLLAAVLATVLVFGWRNPEPLGVLFLLKAPAIVVNFG
jgi:hypothetical protein